MFSEGIYPIGDGLLEVDEERLKGLLVQDEINEIYEVEQTPFARGKFAAVRRAVHKKSGVNFAAKFLKRRRRAQSSDKEIKHEIAVLMLCSGSDNIVKLNAVHESRSDTALLLELATGGELQAVLDNESSLTEAQTRICMREVIKALQFLHNKSIAHLDLKPQNILLTGERIEDGLKLCDFGISRFIQNGSTVHEILGTPDYVAPEVLHYNPLSLQTDIWSVGVLTYVLLSGFSPFGGDTKQETFLNISQCALSFPDDLFNGVSDHALDFIRCALKIQPNDRMTATECLNHIWLKDECSISRKFLSISATEDGVSDDQYDDDIDDDDDDDEEDDEEDEEEDDDDAEEDDVNNDDDENAEKIVTTTPPVMLETRRNSNTIVANGCLKQNGSVSDDYNKENFYHHLNHNVHSIIKQQPKLNKTPPTPTTPSTTNNSSNVTTTVNICLFPDAPTTPKVIRKAPSSDSSPTSVKALVRKFQLESGGEQQTISTPNLLFKEPQQNSQQLPSSINSIDEQKKKHKISPMCSDDKQLIKLNNSNYNSHNKINSNNICNNSSNIKISSRKIMATKSKINGCENDDQFIDSTNLPNSPTNTTKSSQLSSVTSSPSLPPTPSPSLSPPTSTSTATTTQSSPSTPQTVTATAMVTTTSPTTYKTSCVFCLSCGGPGCRHSGSSVTNKTTTNNLGLDQGIIC